MKTLEDLTIIDKYILWAIYTSGSGEATIHEFKPYLMTYLKYHPEKKIIKEGPIRSQVKHLRDIGLIDTKGRRPLRLFITPKYFDIIKKYILTFIEVENELRKNS